MSNTRKRILTGVLLACAFQFTASAQIGSAVDVKKPFEQQRQTVLADLNGDKYSEISPDNKSKVAEAMNRIQRHLEGASSIDRLPEPTRVEIFNDQSLINNILTQAAADSRLICKREKTIGSNFPQNNCLTVAERRRQKNTAQDDVTRMQQVPKKVN
ncbi:hypothetical protein [Stenotrophomonas sp.]|uniref:hypothetical protein n=1 Tax=Stenotrophomonas sp. TaxID=69392 RepID=UPI002D617880|nr:hypothetical protein [Stenotrophomonas sp.]HYQ23870.1 hypothetical protein [Stenotrophomonas sp.]